MLKLLKILMIIVLVTVAGIYFARLVLFPLPDIAGRPVEQFIAASAETKLGKLTSPGSDGHPGLTGVAPLAGGLDALASRMAIIDAAEVSIDAQYYIWHDDTSGILLLDALDRAAKRGVRVRLLLDDNGVPGLDSTLATLNAEPNFHIRLFNPSTVRHPKMLGYAFDFMRMNRRMHNKSLIVDDVITILGGRNIGDEYFEIGESFYKDMDAILIGATVRETSIVFDSYWNSGSVFAIETIIGGKGDRAAFDARVSAVKASEEATTLLSDLRSTATRFLQNAISLEWTKVHLVADDPVKGQGVARRDQLMITRLVDILGEVKSRLDLVSAYFIPGAEGTDYFTTLARSGKTVNVLTNAMNTTDVLLVHAGYTKYRRALLEAGVTLYELKLRGGLSPESEIQLNPLGLSGASLHAKTFAVDDERVFIGSFNFDPRSAILNCEMGVLIDSPAMARQVRGLFDGQVGRFSYRPEISADGRMVWRETEADGRERIWQQEPGTGWFKQAALTVVGLLPVEWML
ncbi:phospholipase D family protein [Neotabrizicola sp. sgz301269]|uniref:phospholipase D family protein n=1 Tax=Neotabrizicola sp. sgz301269 TaxID=3276282 RepID=UPI0037700CE8